VRGFKSKRLEISPSGLTLKYHKASKSEDKKTETEELVLTNMTFASGLHLWEIIAPISCNSIRKSHIFDPFLSEIGVYNPVTTTKVLTSFKTTTPRVITVCLDLNENALKFWLNDKRQANKTVKLTESGPWTPCVTIS